MTLHIDNRNVMCTARYKINYVIKIENKTNLFQIPLQYYVKFKNTIDHTT